MAIEKHRELIDCHDCGKAVAFSAPACPHCGSREPSGPYVMSRREKRLHRIEQRNDQTLFGMLVLCSGIGFFFGGLTVGAWASLGYGLLGLLIAVPAAFVINLSRRLFG